MEPIAGCAAAAGIRESSVYYTDPKRRKKVERDGRPLTCMKRLWKELQTISLPDHATQSIWIRYDEDTPQYSTAFMTGHVDTPYALGLFCFDIYIPNDYPTSPPKVKIVTGRGKARFGPNMYANGKVCLSILGTWPGPQWDPASSNLYQVLISIQSYLLGAQQPWYLEPGFGGWEERIKTSDTGVTTRTARRTGNQAVVQLPPKVVAYNNGLRCRTILFAILDPIQRHGPYAAHPDLVQCHLKRNRKALRAQVDEWATELEERPGKSCREEARFMQNVLVTIMPVLRKSLSSDGDDNEQQKEGEDVETTNDDNSNSATELPPLVADDDVILIDDSSRTEPTIVESSSTEDATVPVEEAPEKAVNGLTKILSSFPWRNRGEAAKKATTKTKNSPNANTIYG